MRHSDAPRTAGAAMITRAALELVLALARYRISVAGEARRALEGWERRAQAISEMRLREIAQVKLTGERLNAEGVGMFAVLAPRRRRSSVARAMIALQVLYDYLDGVSESEASADTDENRGLYEPFIGAFAADGGHRGGKDETAADGGYTQELAGTVRRELAALPGAERVATVLAAGAERCAEAQLRTHAIPHAGIEQARDWAQQHGEGGLHWQETLAGATACVVGLHAVLGAGAHEQTGAEEARAIDRLYLSISAVTTLLDSIVDRESDLSTREPGFTALYESRDALAEGLARATREAVAGTASVPHGAFHLTILAGIIGYYASAEGADSQYARPLIAEARKALGPLVALTTAVWRKWRTAHNFGHAR